MDFFPKSFQKLPSLIFAPFSKIAVEPGKSTLRTTFKMSPFQYVSAEFGELKHPVISLSCTVLAAVKIQMTTIGANGVESATESVFVKRCFCQQ